MVLLAVLIAPFVCRHGPCPHWVDRVEVTEESPMGEADFRVI